MTNLNGTASPGIPGYYDSLGNNPPQTTTGPLNFYVYFSAYGNGGYDPNDVNFPQEADANLVSPIWLQFFTTTSLNHRISPAPNPYTTSATVTANNVLTYEKAQTFQIFSPGATGYTASGASTTRRIRPIHRPALRCRLMRPIRSRVPPPGATTDTRSGGGNKTI